MHLPDQELSSFEPIQLFNTTPESIPVQQDDLNTLAKFVSSKRNVAFEIVEIVFVDESSILDINQKYLGKDYITDVITFRLDDGDLKAIEGTIYCCVPRIKEQATEIGCDQRMEFGRIVTHGLLHLSGMDDSTQIQKNEMTILEDQVLTLWNT
jgi:rRNA maturation RNase YbeY